MNDDFLTISVFVCLGFSLCVLGVLYFMAGRARRHHEKFLYSLPRNRPPQAKPGWVRIQSFTDGMVHVVPVGDREHHQLFENCPCQPWWCEISQAWNHNDLRLQQMTLEEKLLHDAELIKDITPL